VVPHYWFKVPLSNTAPHLRDAKRRGGAPEVTKELRKDAHKKHKSIPHVHYAGDLSECSADVYSPDPMTDAECDWFNETWETGERGCPEPQYDTDETVDTSRGWRFEPPEADEQPSKTS
jgi:hypothetical protein